MNVAIVLTLQEVPLQYYLTITIVSYHCDTFAIILAEALHCFLSRIAFRLYFSYDRVLIWNDNNRNIPEHCQNLYYIAEVYAIHNFIDVFQLSFCAPHKTFSS